MNAQTCIICGAYKGTLHEYFCGAVEVPPNGLVYAVLRLLGASEYEERQAWLVMRFWAREDTPEGVIADAREALRIVRHPAAGDYVRVNAAGAMRVFDGSEWKDGLRPMKGE